MDKLIFSRVSPSIVLLFLLFLVCNSGGAQDFNTMSGDWIRIKAEYQDGQKLPSNHYARVYQRYSFAKDEVYLVVGSNTIPSKYTRTGSNLKIGLIQSFIIEQYTNKTLTLLEADGNNVLRHYLIPTDSFRISHSKYTYTVTNTDTIYNSAVGIEPIYPKGNFEFMNSITQGFSGAFVVFEYTFVVLKDGTIGDVEILASSNEKKNKRLVQMVKKSSGKWIPATINGKLINVKIKDNISLK